MRRVYVSLDGIVEEPAWTAEFWNDELVKYQYDRFFASDALLLGRVTHQGFAAAWPSMTDEAGFADRMNSLPKYIVSTTLEEPLEWNNSSVFKGNVAEEVARLKQQPGQDILIYGGGELVHTLMQHDLIDEYRIMVYPVVLGSGERLFGDGINTTLRLAETRTFSSGVDVFSYRPAEKEGE